KDRGGNLINVYVTLGRYDVVEIFEAPNDETAYGIVLELARHGTVRTETLRAFTREEAEAIVRESYACLGSSAAGDFFEARAKALVVLGEVVEARELGEAGE